MPDLTTFASRQPATFIKGTVFDEEITTSAAMLAKSNLAGWNVRLRPLDSDARRERETFEVIRTNPFDGGLDRLGVAGERYGIVQNEQAFAMFDDLGAKWEAAGSFKNGAVVYGQAAVDTEIVIDPNGVADRVKPFLTVVTSHDSSGALTIGRDALRLDCFNQFRMMLSNLTEQVKIRHTLSVQDRMKKIRLAWKESNTYFEKMDAEANALFQQSVTDKQFFDVVKHLVGERPEENVKGAQTKYDNNLELFAQAWRGPTNEKVYGTKWGAFQALVERNQWGRQLRGKTDDGTPSESAIENFAMAGMGLDIQTNTFRREALAAVRAL